MSQTLASFWLILSELNTAVIVHYLTEKCTKNIELWIYWSPCVITEIQAWSYEAYGCTPHIPRSVKAYTIHKHVLLGVFTTYSFFLLSHRKPKMLENSFVKT